MKRKLAALAAFLVSAVTHAQTPFPPQEPPAYTGPYAGIFFGRSEAKTGCIGVLSGGDRACDATDTAFSLFGGLQMHRNYGVEIGYVNLGKVKANETGPASASSQNVAASLWEAAAMGFLPLHQILPVGRGVSAFARVGAYHAMLTASETGVEDHSNFGWGYGAGLQADFGPKIGLRAQWQRYKNVGGGVYLQQNYDVLGLSALYRFR